MKPQPKYILDFNTGYNNKITLNGLTKMEVITKVKKLFDEVYNIKDVKFSQSIINDMMSRPQNVGRLIGGFVSITKEK